MSQTETVVTRPNVEVLTLAVQLLGIADGRIRDRQGDDASEHGIDLFTPFVASRRIEPLGLAKKLLKGGLKQIHALSVCEESSDGTIGRLDCSNPHGDLAGRGYGEWWSVAMFEYQNRQSLNQALTRGRASTKEAAMGLPIVSFAELEAHVKEKIEDLKKVENPSENVQDLIADLEGTMESIEAIRSLKRATRSVPGFESASPRVDLNCTLILYAPSSGPSDGDHGLWTNPAIRGANRQEMVVDPTDGAGSISGIQ